MNIPAGCLFAVAGPDIGEAGFSASIFSWLPLIFIFIRRMETFSSFRKQEGNIAAPAQIIKAVGWQRV
jgi:hypothetical protein